jgi:sulfate transport system permease protein
MRNGLPGFRLTLGYTIFYLFIIVLLPLATLFFKTAALSLDELWAIFSSSRVLAAAWLSFSTALMAAAINAIFGFIIAWVLVRYEFIGKNWVDALIDLPFALPTAVAGIALASLYTPNGWLGQWFEMANIKIAFTPSGITIALLFIGLPFVVRTVQPVIADMEKGLEEAALSLGATHSQTFWRVLLPPLLPAILTGFTMALARGLGEYGSVIFIAGNLPNVSEILPLLIVIKLEQYEYSSATAIGALMLGLAFILLFIINMLQKRIKS